MLDRSRPDFASYGDQGVHRKPDALVGKQRAEDPRSCGEGQRGSAFCEPGEAFAHRYRQGVAHMKLTCVLATRNRPQMLIDTLKETLRNTVLEDTRILVAADADDHGTLAALHAFANEPRIVASVRDREDDLGSKFNRALEEAPADVYSHMVDYAPFTTPGFDRNLIEIAAKI